MTSAARLAAAGAVAVVAAVTVAAPARAETLGVGWDGDFADPALDDGYRATGTQLVLPVSFTGPPGAEITDITLELTPVPGDDCQDAITYNEEVGTGDGAGSPPTTTPGTPTTPDQPPAPPTTTTESRDTATHTFRVDPGCNGTYDVAVFASTDPPGPGQSGDPGTESGPLDLENVNVSLAPQAPAGVVAEAAADRRVTIRWQAPTTWAGSAPSDALGFQVRRLGADGTPVLVADRVAPNQTTVVDDDLVSAPPGRYRYRVFAIRADASGAPVTSAPTEASLDLVSTGGGSNVPGGSAGAPGPAPTSGGGAVGGGFVPGQPAVTPQEPFEPGFDPELDYSDAELGAEQAVPPGDAGLFDIADDAPGTGVAVPGAVALCLVVWAGHLRHLARRATPPAG